jgi:hypothetical protein
VSRRGPSLQIAAAGPVCAGQGGQRRNAQSRSHAAAPGARTGRRSSAPARAPHPRGARMTRSAAGGRSQRPRKRVGPSPRRHQRAGQPQTSRVPKTSTPARRAGLSCDSTRWLPPEPGVPSSRWPRSPPADPNSQGQRRRREFAKGTLIVAGPAPLLARCGRHRHCLDLDQLAGIPEDSNAQKRARGIMLAECCMQAGTALSTACAVSAGGSSRDTEGTRSRRLSTETLMTARFGGQLAFFAMVSVSTHPRPSKAMDGRCP